MLSNSIITTSLLALTPIFAQEVPELNPEDALRKFSHINKMLMSQITTSHSSSEISKMIQNYGCHCFPGNSKAAGGKGPAQDDIDSLCAQLARCHKCIEFDHGNFVEDGAWDSDIGKYKWSENADGSINCDANTEEHKKDLCVCDAFYATEMGKTWDDASYDYTMWNAKNNAAFDFDFENVCTRAPGAISDDCCGTYPARYPYDSSIKMCCDDAGRTYDDAFYECCADGSIVMMGMC
jgi:hypothetical protein